MGTGLFSVPVFNDRMIYLIFVGTHLYLHGRGIGSKFKAAEMVEEK